MRIRPILLAALAVSLGSILLPQGVAAQTESLEACKQAVLQRNERVRNDEMACLILGGLMVIPVFDPLYTSADAVEEAIDPSYLQPARTGTANATGTGGESGAVPPAQPVALGAGSLSAVGSEAGADAITAVSLNPATFFATDGSDQSLAKAMRVTDLTIFFPVDGLDNDEDGDVDYFGTRIRVNFTGLSAGEEVWSGARRAYLSLLADETRAARMLGERLQTMTPAEIQRCVNAAFAAEPDHQSIAAACRGDLVPDLNPSEYRQFRTMLDDLRARADAKYLGLDLRLDFGDPTLGAVENADATSIIAALAFGRQFVGANSLSASSGLRGRLGVRYVELTDLDETEFAAEGGIAFVYRNPVTFQQALEFSAGLEFRFGGIEERLEEAAQSEYLTFRGALQVPIADRTGITVSFGTPIIGDAPSSTLSVSWDWNLLFPSPADGL